MKSIIPFLFLAGATVSFGQSFQSASEEARGKLGSALDELNEIQADINSAKPELAAQLDEVEATAFRLRDEASNASRLKNVVDVEVSQLNNEKQNVIDTNNYIQSTLLNEYIRRLDLTVNPAEIPLYTEQIRTAIGFLETDEQIDDATIFENQLQIIELSLDRIEKLLGGDTFAGSALVEGNIMQGDFVLVGPASYFYSESGVGGITEGMRNNLANIYVLPEEASLIQGVTSANSGTLPIDTTNGEALLAIDEDITLLEEIKLGGLVMYPILGLFTLAILIALFKLIELSGVKPAKSEDIDTILDFLRKGDKEGASAHADKVGGEVGGMLSAAVQNADEDREVIEEVLYEKIIKTQPKLERFLAFIAVTAATAPLLGLLGTVTGMIKTFKLITIVGTGDARNLSGGISEALITTKWGLIVAIPTLIFHALLSRKAKGVVGSMEQAAVGFINGIIEMRESSQSQES